jgi:hypothetical protein
MNWEATAAIGQMLGSIAVFVTLGYLAVQARHARGEVRRSINQSRSETVRQFDMTYATDERLNNVRQKSRILLDGQPTDFARELMERSLGELRAGLDAVLAEPAVIDAHARAVEHLFLGFPHEENPR